MTISEIPEEARGAGSPPQRKPKRSFELQPLDSEGDYRDFRLVETRPRTPSQD